MNSPTEALHGLSERRHVLVRTEVGLVLHRPPRVGLRKHTHTHKIHKQEFTLLCNTLSFLLTRPAYRHSERRGRVQQQVQVILQHTATSIHQHLFVFSCKNLKNFQNPVLQLLTQTDIAVLWQKSLKRRRKNTEWIQLKLIDFIFLELLRQDFMFLLSQPPTLWRD